MSDGRQYPALTGWKCARCNAPLQVRTGARYHACASCGAAFRMQWRGGQIESHQGVADISRAMDPAIGREELASRLLESRNRLHALNDRIRRFEMAKGGERLRVFATFIVICAAIYSIFRLTVEGVEALSKIGQLEIGLAGVTGAAVLLLIGFRMRRATMVRRVIRLHAQRNELETELEAFEAAMDLRFGVDPDAGRTPESFPIDEAAGDAPAPEQSDIIGRFASRKKEGRSRLNIRDED